MNPKNLAPAVAHFEKTKTYPLRGKAAAKPMVFPDASGVPVNMLPISDGSVFNVLKQLMDREGTNFADADWLGMLAAIGIVQGQPFNPDAHTRVILDYAAKTAYKMSRVIGFQETVSGRSFRVYPDRHWINPMADAAPGKPSGALDLSGRRIPEGYRDLDARIWYFTNYYSVSPGMLSQIPGKGAKYMVAFTDSRGKVFSGDSNYRLNLPPKVPVANFWSVTLYDAANGFGLANGQPSRRWVRATSRVKTSMVARTFIWGPGHPRANRAIGYPRFLGRGILLSSGSRGRPKQRSLEPGSRATSKKWSDNGLKIRNQLSRAWSRDVKRATLFP